MTPPSGILTMAVRITRENNNKSQKPSQTMRWSRLEPNCYGRRQKQQKTKNLVEIEAYLKPSWVLASTNKTQLGFSLDQ
jgi:hypothetical protein